MPKNIFGTIAAGAVMAAVFTHNAGAISWIGDMDAALRRARSSRKPVMADFSTGGCGWCKKLDSETYADTSVVRLAARFICVKVDCDRGTALPAKYGVRGYPTVIFLYPDGKVIDRVNGFVDAGGMAAMMRKALEKSDRKWKKDPVIAPGDKSRAASPFSLTGIIYDKRSPRAIINGALLGEGDSVGNGKISKITKTNVTISLKDKDIILSL